MKSFLQAMNMMGKIAEFGLGVRVFGIWGAHPYSIFQEASPVSCVSWTLIFCNSEKTCTSFPGDFQNIALYIPDL